MWYLAVFAAAVVVDLIPVMAPPAWPILVFFLVRYELNSWLVILLGAVGATLGRYWMTLYLPHVGKKILNESTVKNLDYLKNRLSRSPKSVTTFVFLYTLSPLSTAALFTAVGLAGLRSWFIFTGFFVGKLIGFSIFVQAGGHMAESLESAIENGFTWPRLIVSVLAVGLLLFTSLFLNWQKLLEHGKFEFNFPCSKKSSR